MKTNKLLLIQAALKCPKNQINKFGGYNYRSCEDILEAVKPLLYDTQTTLTISDEIVAVGDRIYVKATATLKDSETWEIVESNTAFARESESKKWMDESQITWASSSYARKYALNGLFLLDDVKDADATNDHWKTSGSKETVSWKTSTSNTPSTTQNPQGWFQKAISNEKFMLECISEDDFIGKIKDKYDMDEIVEWQLRAKYKEVKGWEKVELPFGD